MRNLLLGVMSALAIGTGANLMTAAPAAAGAGYPVCMYGPFERMDCRYSNFGQCAATASGLGATCLNNPAYVGRAAYIEDEAPRRPGRRKHWHREAY